MADGKSDKKKKQDAGDEAAPTGPAPTPRLKKLFEEEVGKKLAEQFGLTNPMQRPTLDAIVLNVNVGRHLENGKLSPNIRETVNSTLTTISGQKPITIKAKKSVSNFKLRDGMDSAMKVTLRRDRMWHFLDRLINLATPRIKDFRGLRDTSFDRQGNYSMGLNEQGVFPEVDMARVTFTHGMNINLVFSRSSPELSRFVLEQLGMPFEKKEDSDKKGAA